MVNRSSRTRVSGVPTAVTASYLERSSAVPISPRTPAWSKVLLYNGIGRVDANMLLK